MFVESDEEHTFRSAVHSVIAARLLALQIVGVQEVAVADVESASTDDGMGPAWPFALLGEHELAHDFVCRISREAFSLSIPREDAVPQIQGEHRGRDQVESLFGWHQ